jgi:hypothetical protein
MLLITPLKKLSLLWIFLSGIMISMFFFTTTAFFFPLNTAVSVTYNGLILVFFFKFKTLIVHQLNQHRKAARLCAGTPKVLFLFVVITVVLVSAMPPFLIDNESYYIQSIQWLNEAGFVKGLANLHPFLGQMSAWHVLEAGLNWQFLGPCTNDINGFLTIIVMLYAAWKVVNKVFLYGTLLLFAPFFIFFTNSPSPDLPVFLVILLVVIQMLDFEKTQNNFLGYVLPLMVFGLLMIKITVIPFVLLIPLIPYHRKQKLFIFFVAATTTFSILMKNYLVTGWFTYPFPWWLSEAIWTLPQAYYRFEANESAINFTTSPFANTYIVTAILTSAFLVADRYSKLKLKKAHLIMTTALIQTALIYYNAVSSRLALPGLLVLGLLLLHKLNFNKIFFQKKYAHIILIMACGTSLLVLNLVDFKSDNRKIGHGGKSLQAFNVLLPAKPTRFSEMRFVEVKEGNLIFNSPQDNLWLFGTYQGPLPCVSAKQLKYFKNKFQIVPQQLGHNLEDGFYSKKTEHNE